MSLSILAMLRLDGVFVEDGDVVRWVRVPAPTTDEVQQLATDPSTAHDSR